MVVSRFSVLPKWLCDNFYFTVEAQIRKNGEAYSCAGFTFKISEVFKTSEIYLLVESDEYKRAASSRPSHMARQIHITDLTGFIKTVNGQYILNEHETHSTNFW